LLDQEVLSGPISLSIRRMDMTIQKVAPKFPDHVIFIGGAGGDSMLVIA
jgi:hypothetical protein